MGGSASSANHVSILGLDGAGKTTLLYRMKLGQYISTAPTISYNCEKIRTESSSFEVWDVGGQEALRPLWRSYTRRAGAVVFVVDAAATDRLSEAKAELQRTAKLQECAGLPFLILANKQDLPGALSVQEVTLQLGVSELGPSHAYNVIGTCGVTGEGLNEVLLTLQTMMLKRKR